MLALETPMLAPALWFALLVITYVGLAIVWPAIDAARRGGYIWMIAIIVFSPIAGILRLALRDTKRLSPA